MDNDDLGSDDLERFLPDDARYRRLHRGVRLDPESVWEELRAYLCEPDHDPFDSSTVDLIEDLMFWHADSFVARLEGLVNDCASLRETVAWAHVGGTAAAGVDRFHALQQRLLEDIEVSESRHAGLPTE